MITPNKVLGQKIARQRGQNKNLPSTKSLRTIKNKLGQKVLTIKMKFTKEQILTILTLRKENKSVAEIATTLGMSVSTVSYWIRRLKKAGHKVTKARRMGRPGVDLTIVEGMPVIPSLSPSAFP